MDMHRDAPAGETPHPVFPGPSAPATGHDEASPEGQRRCHAESQARQVSGDSTTRLTVAFRRIAGGIGGVQQVGGLLRGIIDAHQPEACANAKLHPLPFELHRGEGVLQAVGDAP